MHPSEPHWQVRDRFLETRSRWVTLIGEHLITETGQELEYWRVERASSAIILPIQQDAFILPPACYRPGVGRATLDFPGGRVPAEKAPDAWAPVILQRELGIGEAAIADLSALNPDGWMVDSSFSNQSLYGFVARLHPQVIIPESFAVARYPITPAGIQALLSRLLCLQCRALLLEWCLGQELGVRSASPPEKPPKF